VRQAPMIPLMGLMGAIVQFKISATMRA
jgi:hypothetical protein